MSVMDSNPDLLRRQSELLNKISIGAIVVLAITATIVMAELVRDILHEFSRFVHTESAQSIFYMLTLCGFAMSLGVISCVGLPNTPQVQHTTTNGELKSRV